MSLIVLPDVEKMVIDYWMTVPEVTALVDTNIGSEPHGSFACLTCSRQGGGADPIPHWIDRARIHGEAWDESKKMGGSKEKCRLIAATALAALVGMVNVAHELGVVTDVEPALGPFPLPDPDTKRLRYIFDAIVVVHPHRGA